MLLSPASFQGFVNSARTVSSLLMVYPTSLITCHATVNMPPKDVFNPSINTSLEMADACRIHTEHLIKNDIPDVKNATYR